MSKYSQFEDLLKELEMSFDPDRNLKPLYKFLKNDNVFVPLFESYITKRLENNINPERLLNLAYHCERSLDTQHLSDKINKKLSSRIIQDQENYDQFLYMYKHDTRVERNVLKGVLERLKYANANELAETAEKISPYIGVDKHALMLRVLEHDSEIRNLANLMIVERLKVEDQYGLLKCALENNSKIFVKAFDWASDLHTYLSDQVQKEGDQEPFIMALANSTIPIAQIQTGTLLNDIFTTFALYIPNTLDKLCLRAEKEEQWEYLLTLGVNKNKKDLLRSIVKAKDQKLIDKFFSLYKSCPEVKHLVPFM